MHNKIVCFTKFSNHKRRTIGGDESFILQWVIKKLFIITVDIESSNNTTIDNFE